MCEGREGACGGRGARGGEGVEGVVVGKGWQQLGGLTMEGWRRGGAQGEGPLEGS